MYWQSQTRAWLHASQTELPIGCSRRFHKTGLPKEGHNEEACCDKHALVCEYSLVCDICILCSVLPPNVELYTFGKTSLNVILNKIRFLFYSFTTSMLKCFSSSILYTKGALQLLFFFTSTLINLIVRLFFLWRHVILKPKYRRCIWTMHL